METFEEIMNLYKGGIYQLGLRLFFNREKAARFCQDVFIKAYETRSEYNPDLPIKPWLFQVAANYGMDAVRKKHEVVVPDGNVPELPEKEHAEAIFQKRELKRKIWSVVVRLNATYREIIALRFSSDVSLKEIAAVLGISLAAAKVRLCRGVKAFEEEFKAEGGEEYVM